jgi:hypothetical protein
MSVVEMHATSQMTYLEGVHLGLPLEEYLADPALGSTDLRLLRRNPTSYWHFSHMNPQRQIKTTPYLERGTALHVLLLEGDRAFANRYLRGRERPEYLTPAEKGALTKAENKRAAAEGMEVLPAADYDRVLKSRIIINRHPIMSTCFTNGIPEVSVFWRRDGVRRKARLDYLKTFGVGDLKSAGNPYSRDFREVCTQAIRNYDYGMQAAHYLEARGQIPAQVQAGKVTVHPMGEVQFERFRSVVTSVGLGWQWVFFCTDGAPDAMSYKWTAGNPMLEQAGKDVEIAVARYVGYKRKFGNAEWVLIREVEELTWEHMPPWYGRPTIEDTEEYDEWMVNKPNIEGIDP